MAYNATNWQDNVTPVDAEHLNNIEDGISALDNDKADQSDVDALKTSKADQSDLDALSTKVDEEMKTRAEKDDEQDEKIQSNTDLIDSSQYYQAGDEISFAHDFYLCGGITSSAKTIYITIPLPKGAQTTPTVSCSQLTVRGVSGYIVNGLTDFAGITFSAQIQTPIGVRISIVNEDGWNATNNTPVCVCMYSLVMKF